MNTQILKKLSTQKLKELKAAIEEEIAVRFDFSMLPGRTGRFIGSGDGKERYVEIVRVNPKSVTVRELPNSVNPGGQWKVPKNMVKMDGVERDLTMVAMLHKSAALKDERPSANYDVESW